MQVVERHISNYLFGKGIETSKDPLLVHEDSTDLTLCYKEPNNLYHFYADENIDYESFDFVFNKDLLHTTKFYKILLKEWFFLLKVGGKLVVRFPESPRINNENISHIFASLIGERGEILYMHKENDDQFTVVVSKLESCLAPSDSIGNWSFCIINPEGLELGKLVESIRSQNVPNCEILIYSPKPASTTNGCNAGTRYVDIDVVEGALSPSAALKNWVLLHAKYENVIIIDRRKADLTLSDSWFSAMVRYGNHFEALSCALVTSNGERYADWWTLGQDKKRSSDSIFQRTELGLLEYRDWDDWVYFPDPICILKKRLYKNSLWDIYSHEGDENTRFCHELHNQGFLTRLNTELVCNILDAKEESLGRSFPVYKFNSNQLGERRKKFLRRVIWNVTEILIRFECLKSALFFLRNLVKKTKIHKIIAR